jgi:hypothetical protein
VTGNRLEVPWIRFEVSGQFIPSTSVLTTLVGAAYAVTNPLVIESRVAYVTALNSTEAVFITWKVFNCAVFTGVGSIACLAYKLWVTTWVCAEDFTLMKVSWRHTNCLCLDACNSYKYGQHQTLHHKLASEG